MVRKIIVFVVTCLALVVFALADTTYTGSLSTSYITYAADLYRGLDTNEDYVFSRTGQYEYTLFVGELERRNGRVDSADGGTVYRFTNVQSDGYYGGSNYVSLTSAEVDSYFLVFGDELVYSSIDGLPSFETNERELGYIYVSTFILAAMFVLSVLRSVFFSSRR